MNTILHPHFTPSALGPSLLKSGIPSGQSSRFRITLPTRWALAALLVLFCLDCPRVNAQSTWGTQLSVTWFDAGFDTLGLGVYDTDSNGYGAVLSNVDLGVLDSSLTGILMNLSVSGPGRWVYSGSGMTATAQGDVTLTFGFSQPVAFSRFTGSGPVSWTLSESESLLTGADYISDGTGILDIVPASGLVNNTALVTADVELDHYNTTQFVWNHQGISQLNEFRAAEAVIVPVPEPAGASLIAICGVLVAMRRRR